MSKMRSFNKNTNPITSEWNTYPFYMYILHE